MKSFSRSLKCLLAQKSYNRLKIFHSSGAALCKFGTTTVEHRKLKSFDMIPQAPRLPLLGHLHLFSKFGPYTLEKLYDAYSDLHTKYGPIVRLDMGIKMLLLFNPEDIAELFAINNKYPQRPGLESLKQYRLQKQDSYSSGGLVTENGDEWLRLRKLVNFLLSPKFAETYFPFQEEVAEDFVSYVRRIKGADGVVTDFLKELYRYTEEAVGVLCFGSRLGLFSDSPSHKEFSDQLTKAAEDTFDGIVATMFGLPWWKIFRTTGYKKLEKSQEFFLSVATSCLQNAKKELKNSSFKHDPKLEFFWRVIENEKLKETDINLLMTELFSAGIDSTGNSIGFLLYHLALHPEVQEKLYQDIRKNSANGIKLDAKSVDAMKYLRACMKESQRLTPAAGGTARILSSPTVISGYMVPKDVTCIGVNPIICLKDEHFEKPKQFIPERWLEGETMKNQNKSHPYCVLPFGHGVRRCIGQRFAEQEIRLAVVKLIQKFKVDYVGESNVGVKMRLSLIPDKPLDFRFVER